MRLCIKKKKKLFDQINFKFCSDDDLFFRSRLKFGNILKVDAKTARIYTADHKQDEPNPDRSVLYFFSQLIH